MKSGYKLMWSNWALADLKKIMNYLAEEWTQREIKIFVGKLDKRLTLISANSNLFPKTTKRRNVRKSVLTKQTVIYYEAVENQVIIITLFDSRQNPEKLPR